MNERRIGRIERSGTLKLVMEKLNTDRTKGKKGKKAANPLSCVEEHITSCAVVILPTSRHPIESNLVSSSLCIQPLFQIFLPSFHDPKTTFRPERKTISNKILSIDTACRNVPMKHGESGKN